MKQLIKIAALIFWLVLVTGCQAEAPPPLPPDEYLEAALTWMEVHAANGVGVDWTAVRAEAQEMATGANTTADTYPAIEFAIEQLQGGIGYLIDPERIETSQARAIGIDAVYPEGIVYRVQKNSPAEKAGIQAGDIVEAMNGKPIERLTKETGQPQQEDAYYTRLVNIPWDEAVDLEIRHPGQDEAIKVALVPTAYDLLSAPAGKSLALDGRQAGYLFLDADWGSEDYPTRVQAIMRDIDSANTCSWIIDLRLAEGGDLWSYIAAVGPILGEGELGGFLYTDGSKESWSYRDGKVYWADEERIESYVRGPIYAVQQPTPPVVLLTSRVTRDAGELLIAAFRGRADVRTFGEATAGIPHLNLHSPLSDGAEIFVSGALGMDRQGRVYNGPILPDEPVIFDWGRIGQADDAALQAAKAWLAAQPACQS